MNLNNATEAYNKTVGTLESRVMVSARRFQDLGIGTDEIELLEPIEQLARPLDEPELLEHVDSDGAIVPVRPK